jgi:hypothetical protein
MRPVLEPDLRDRAPVAVDIAYPDPHLLGEDEIRGELLRTRPERLARLWAIDPVEPDPHLATVAQHANRVTVRDRDDVHGVLGADRIRGGHRARAIRDRLEGVRSRAALVAAVATRLRAGVPI